MRLLISNHFCDSVSGPEKAVGGSIPSLATILSNNLAGNSTELPLVVMLARD
jgi:hypothetical protein